MKKFIISIMAAFALAFGLSACGTQSASNDKLKVITTIFPEYDWVMQVLGEEAEHADVTMLMDNGVDMHSFQPTAADILKISNCDVFIYVGGESDEWVEDALKEAKNKNMQVINLLDVLGDSAKEEEVVEGMQQEEHEQDEHHTHEDEMEYDEHVWLSLKNAEIFTKEIATVLGKADEEHAQIYENNAAEYVNKLTELDASYKEVVKNTKVKTVLFGDRFPFRYLVDDYDLDYYAAFVGCSAETEASFSTITFLSKKVDELGLKAIFTIENSDQKIAKTILENTAMKNQTIVTLDSMQSTTSKDIKNGKTYLSVMQSNLDTLKTALY